MTALTALEQAAVNLIAANNGCGASSKEALKDDNMTWFNINDLMTGLGWTRHRAAGVMSALADKGLAMDNEKGAKVRYDRDSWTLTDEGIDASNLGAEEEAPAPAPVAAKAAKGGTYVVTLRFAHPAHDEVNGIPYEVEALNSAAAIKATRGLARRDGHVPAIGKGTVTYRCRRV